MKKEVSVLEGAWTIVSLEIGGQKMPAGSARIVVKGDHFTTTGMGAAYEGTIAVDANKRPKTLDMNFLSGPEKGNKNLGIFEVKGDTWRLCLDMTGKSRPKEFASKPGVALETLKRIKADEKKPVQNVKFDVVPTPELDGEWAMVSCTVNGDALPVSMAKHGKRVARDNEITVSMAGQTILKARFTVGRNSNPMTIDYLLSTGEQQQGIYELDGKNLRVISAAPGQPRPADFSTAKGDGKTFTVWKLIKP